MTDDVTYNDILVASERLKKYAHLPPAVPFIDVPELAKHVGAKGVTIVLDTPRSPGLPDGGHTFKLRGAGNMMFAALEERAANRAGEKIGFVAASAGNHAQGVAAAANRAGMVGLLQDGDSVDIFMPVTAPKIKQDNTKRLGGDKITLHLVGQSFRETRAASERHEQELKAKRITVVDVHPFDDTRVIAGQGTLGTEIFERAKPDIIFAPCGGGGLLAGIAIAAKQLSPKTQVIGAEPDYAPSGCQALGTIGSAAPMPKNSPAAGGILTHEIGKLARDIFKSQHVYMHSVSQDMLLFSTLWLHRFLKHQTNKDANYAYDAELSASASLAALLNASREEVAGKNIVLVVSGANREITETELQALVTHDDLQHFPRQKTLCYPAVPAHKEIAV